MDDLDLIDRVDMGDPVFRLSPEHMRDESCWVALLGELGLIHYGPHLFRWGAKTPADLGMTNGEYERMKKFRSVLLKRGHGAYLDARRVNPETWKRIELALGDDIIAIPVSLASNPVAESIVTRLLDDLDTKDEISQLFEVDLMPLREALKSKFQLSSVVIHVQRGVHFPNHAAVHFCVARQGTANWNGDEQLAIRTFIMAELNKYTEVKRRKEIEHEVRVEPKKLEGQWPYLRLVFSIVFSAEAPQFLGVDSD